MNHIQRYLKTRQRFLSCWEYEDCIFPIGADWETPLPSWQGPPNGEGFKNHGQWLQIIMGRMILHNLWNRLTDSEKIIVLFRYGDDQSPLEIVDFITK